MAQLAQTQSGYLILSGTSDELNQFEKDFLQNGNIATQTNITGHSSKAWCSNLEIAFKFKGSKGFHRGKLPLKANAPVTQSSHYRDKSGNSKSLQQQAVPRTFKQYSIKVPQGANYKSIPHTVADWLEQERKIKTAYLPSIEIDRHALVKAAHAVGNPVDAPIPEDAIPEPSAKAKDYLGQDYFKRIGLIRDNGLSQYQADETGAVVTYGAPRFEVHRKALGAGTVVVVIDTAPKIDTTGVDWTSVDAFIDLNPEERLQDITIDPAPKPSVAQPFHGLMVANLIKVIAPDTRIILVRALDDNGLGYTPDILQIINYLVNTVPGQVKLSDLAAGLSADSWIPKDSRLIFNMSMVLADTSDPVLNSVAMFNAVDDATMKGVLFVCAAGNNGLPGLNIEPEEPAAYGLFPGYNKQDYESLANTTIENSIEVAPSAGPMGEDPYNMVIGVASSAKFARFLFSSFSNASPLAAPSTEILLDPGCELTLADVARNPAGLIIYDDQTNGYTVLEGATKPTSRFVRWSGTSFSAPLVTGQAALLAGQRVNSNASPVPLIQIKEKIWETAYKAKYWNRPSEINIEKSLA